MSTVEAVLFPTPPKGGVQLSVCFVCMLESSILPFFVPLSGLIYFKHVLLSSAMYYYVGRRDVAWTWRIIKVTLWVGLKYV